MDCWLDEWMEGWRDGGMAGLKNKHKENRVFYRIFRNSSHTFWLVLVINKNCCFWTCFIEILFMLWLPVKNFKFWHTYLVNPPKLGVALKLSPEGREVKNWLGDHSRISFIIIHSPDRLVAQLTKIFAKIRYKDTCPQVAFANLGGTVILKHYNEIINIY